MSLVKHTCLSIAALVVLLTTSACSPDVAGLRSQFLGKHVSEVEKVYGPSKVLAVTSHSSGSFFRISAVTFDGFTANIDEAGIVTDIQPD